MYYASIYIYTYTVYYHIIICILHVIIGEEGPERHLRPPQHQPEDRLEEAHVQKGCVITCVQFRM